MKTKQHLVNVMAALVTAWKVRKLNRHERRTLLKVSRMLKNREVNKD